MNWITLNSPRISNFKLAIPIALVRVIFALFMIIGHGWPKFAKILSGDFGFADPLGLGAKTSLFLIVFAELLCAVAVILGFMTRWALLPLMFAMLVAAFVVNAGQPFTQMEKALMFFVIFAFLWITGPGAFSVDNALSKKEKA